MHFSIWRSTDAGFYWELVGDGGEVLAVSRSHRQKEAAEEAIESLQRAGSEIETIDRSGANPLDRQLP